jgi:hypothetical protein
MRALHKSKPGVCAVAGSRGNCRQKGMIFPDFNYLPLD